ncbi:MAG TPA: calcium-binding protein [Allosphingosinicella sp.]|jgi:Ca2+-binding RTX toxin-like protein
MTTGTAGNDNLSNDPNVQTETVDALGGGDRITYVRPNFSPSASIAFNGGDGFDTLIINENTLRSSSATGFDGSLLLRVNSSTHHTINYTSIERLELSASLLLTTSPFRVDFGDGQDILRLTPFVAGMDAQIWTHGGEDEVYLSGSFGNVSVVTGAGPDLLSFQLLTTGSVGAYGGTGNDVYEIASGTVTPFENADEGTDTVRTARTTYTLGANVENLTGESDGGQTLNGNELGNVIVGGGGNDAVNGLGADDTLTGNAGLDGLNGGEGSDKADYAREGGTLGVVVNLGSTVVAPDGHPTFGRGVNPNEAIDTYGQADILSSIENARGTEQADWLYGSDEANWLDGMGGSDHLEGAGGDDILAGGAGADRMIGGTGNDVYIVDDAGDTVEENPEAGTDETRTTLAAYTLGANVENLTGLSNAGQSLTGNAGANVIEGGSGNDTLDGGGGGDTLIGDGGNDVYIARGGEQIVEESGGGDDEIRTDLAAYSMTGTSNVETLRGTSSGGQSLTGSDASETIIGGEGNDTLVGLDGDDHLIGNGGNDFLFGHIGADIVEGGLGDDIYLIDAADTIVEHFGEGTDEVRTVGTLYVLGAGLDNLRGLNDTGHDFRGNAGPNAVIGAGGNDILRMQDGGDDLAFGKGGVDSFYFGAAFDQYDQVDGGDNRDSLILQGDYDLTLVFAPTGGSSIIGIESISLVPGNNASFGDTANRLYSYDLTMIDGNVAAGALMKVNGFHLRAGENFALDASAELDAPLQIFAGLGRDTLIGGAQGDSFVFGQDGRFSAGDTVVGGGGYDILYLRGDYAIDFNAAGFAGSFSGVESIALLTSANTEFVGGGDGDFDYSIVWNDAMLAAGAVFTINGSRLQAHESFAFDGSRESDGQLRVFGGAASDTLATGAAADFLYGGGGGDMLTGGAGADEYRYQNVSDSIAAASDTIFGFEAGIDRIDLARIDAVAATAQDDAFAFIGAATFSGAGQLRAVELSAGIWRVEGNVDGDLIADFVLEVHSAVPLTAADFLL